MKHSRVTKFKAYRDSFIKAGAEDINGASDIISGLSGDNSLSSTTNTLPYDEVIHKIEEQEEVEKVNKKAKRNRLLKIIGYSFIGAVLVIGTIIIGILAFSGGK